MSNMSGEDINNGLASMLQGARSAGKDAANNGLGNTLVTAIQSFLVLPAMLFLLTQPKVLARI
jgi:hypothetical protein